MENKSLYLYFITLHPIFFKEDISCLHFLSAFYFVLRPKWIKIDVWNISLSVELLHILTEILTDINELFGHICVTEKHLCLLCRPISSVSTLFATLYWLIRFNPNKMYWSFWQNVLKFYDKVTEVTYKMLTKSKGYEYFCKTLYLN